MAQMSMSVPWRLTSVQMYKKADFVRTPTVLITALVGKTLKAMEPYVLVSLFLNLS